MKRPPKTKRTLLKPYRRYGELQRLGHDAREQLNDWFREDEGRVPYREIRQRLEEKFGCRTSIGALGDYYRKNVDTIKNPFGGKVTTEPSILIVRIEVPAGCRVGVSTETIAAGKADK